MPSEILAFEAAFLGMVIALLVLAAVGGALHLFREAARHRRALRMKRLSTLFGGVRIEGRAR